MKRNVPKLKLLANLRHMDANGRYELIAFAMDVSRKISNQENHKYFLVLTRS